MRMGFIFNVRFPYYKNQYYAVDLPGDVWKNRYLKYCDRIKVIGRKDEVKDNPSPKIGLSSIDKVDFACVDNESYVKRFLHRRKDARHIMREISGCDFVICRGSWGTRECRKAKIPYLVEVVGCEWDALWNHSWQGKIAALPRYIALKRAVKKAPFVLYVTKEFLQARYPTNGIHVGISDVKLKSADDIVLSHRIEKIANKPLNSKLILATTAAIDVKYKGQQYVIEALGKLKKQGVTNIEYQLVGGGKADYLRNVAKSHNVLDQVIFKGAMPHEQVFDWLDTIDIYVQPSLQEGLPRAVVEAMSRACPVFGARTGGIPELVDSSFVFKRKCVNQIAQMIQGFNRENMIIQARRSFKKAKEFDPHGLDNQRDAFYRSFINSFSQSKIGG